MSPSQGRHRPIRRVTLKFEAESEKEDLTALQKRIPGARVSGRSLSKSFSASEPEEALEELKKLADVIRKGAKAPEGFK